LHDGFCPFRLLLAALLLAACGHDPAPAPGDHPAPEPDAGGSLAPDAALRPDAPVVNAPDGPAPLAADAAVDGGAANPDGAAPLAADAAAGPAAVLIYTRADAFVHDTRGAAAMAIKKKLAALGITATISEDPALISAEKLAPLAAVILIDNTGNPFGNPGTAAIEALGGYVRAGHGLVGIHAATSGYEMTPAYVALLGGHFKEHPGSVRLGHCQPVGDFPSVVKLPATFSLVDEFYVFDQYRNDNLVDLQCDALTGTTKLPIAWHRLEGQGRIFYTALGHEAAEWSNPMIVDDHVIPGILWSMGR
jgi:type 1 glutamine amidotransferase